MEIKINKLALKFSLIFFLLILSCKKSESKSYILTNANVKGSHYKITNYKDNRLLIEKFSKNKLYFDYSLKKKDETYFFSDTDKLINERGNPFMSKNKMGRIYSYIDDLDGKPIKDSLIIDNKNGVYTTTVKSIGKGYLNGVIFYYDENFIIDSIYVFGSEVSLLFK